MKSGKVIVAGCRKGDTAQVSRGAESLASELRGEKMPMLLYADRYGG